MPILFKHTKDLEAQLDRFLDAVSEGALVFRRGIDAYIAGDVEGFERLVEEIDGLESRADELRREIKSQLYRHSLIPESRGDILGTLESVDRLLTAAEWTLYEVRLQEIKIPEPIKPNVVKVVDLTCSCCEMVQKAVRALFVNSGRAADIEDLINEIDNIESEVDHLERALIRAIFKLDIDTGEKLVLKALVRRLTKVSDGAEHVGDRLTVISVKRRV